MVCCHVHSVACQREIKAQSHMSRNQSRLVGTNWVTSGNGDIPNHSVPVLQIEDDGITVDGKKIKIVSNRDPLQLPWKEMDVDIVIEGTGVFVDEAGAGKHIEAGAKKVLITAPGKGDIPTFVVGVNEGDYKHEYPIISNASCTTNCMAPFVKVLNVSSYPFLGTHQHCFALGCVYVRNNTALCVNTPIHVGIEKITLVC